MPALKLAAVQLKAVDPASLWHKRRLERPRGMAQCRLRGAQPLTSTSRPSARHSKSQGRSSLIGTFHDPTAVRVRTNVDLGPTPDDAFVGLCAPPRHGVGGPRGRFDVPGSREASPQRSPRRHFVGSALPANCSQSTTAASWSDWRAAVTPVAYKLLSVTTATTYSGLLDELPARRKCRSR
jgi:hypothetical protein